MALQLSIEVPALVVNGLPEGTTSEIVDFGSE
jgi:hypothetical protein